MVKLGLCLIRREKAAKTANRAVQGSAKRLLWSSGFFNDLELKFVCRTFPLLDNRAFYL